MSQGINVFVWNYRGVGQSEGVPSPKKLKEDSELVAAYVRSKVPAGIKVGAHGQSMGGMIAAHLARKGLVDFVFCDRTFFDLSEVAQYMMGKWAKYGMRAVTFWGGLDSTSDFIYSNCYKVLGQDPADEIINDNASLKTGISLAIIQAELKNRFLERTFEAQSTSDSIEKLPTDISNDYSHILTREETSILFTNLNSLFARIVLLEVHNKKLRKKIHDKRVKGGTARLNLGDMSELSMKLELHASGGSGDAMTTQEDLLNQSDSKN